MHMDGGPDQAFLRELFRVSDNLRDNPFGGGLDSNQVGHQPALEN